MKMTHKGILAAIMAATLAFPGAIAEMIVSESFTVTVTPETKTAEDKKPEEKAAAEATATPKDAAPAAQDEAKTEGTEPEKDNGENAEGEAPADPQGEAPADPTDGTEGETPADGTEGETPEGESEGETPEGETEGETPEGETEEEVEGENAETPEGEEEPAEPVTVREEIALKRLKLETGADSAQPGETVKVTVNMELDNTDRAELETFKVVVDAGDAQIIYKEDDDIKSSVSGGKLKLTIENAVVSGAGARVNGSGVNIKFSVVMPDEGDANVNVKVFNSNGSEVESHDTEDGKIRHDAVIAAAEVEAEAAEEPAEETEPVEEAAPIELKMAVNTDPSKLEIGDRMELTAVITGLDDVEYTVQWQRRSEGGDWTDIAGANGSVYSFEMTEDFAGCEWRYTVDVK